MTYLCNRPARRAVAALILLGLLFSIAASGQTTNGVYREAYTGIAGNAISDLTNSPSYPGGASVESLEPIFEGPTGWADNYGTRMRALVTAPQTGNYIFWIATDDNGQLYVST